MMGDDQFFNEIQTRSVHSPFQSLVDGRTVDCCYLPSCIEVTRAKKYGGVGAALPLSWQQRKYQRQIGVCTKTVSWWGRKQNRTGQAWFANLMCARSTTMRLKASSSCWQPTQRRRKATKTVCKLGRQPEVQEHLLNDLINYFFHTVLHPKASAYSENVHVRH